jgi:hypothetical protein
MKVGEKIYIRYASYQDSSNKRTKVFLSHAHEDAEVADRIGQALQEAGVSAFYHQLGLSPGDSINRAISSELSASDFVVLLLSPAALQSSWMMEEVETLARSEWRQRAISLIPVKIRPCRIPDFLYKWSIIDATRSFSRGMEKLVQVLRVAPYIDLYYLKPPQFEELVIALLKAYGFRKVKRASFMDEYAFDIVAEYRTKDPFGRSEVQEWLIEVKYHAGKIKTDISALREFLGAIALRKERAQALFVTASQLTSAAREWIESLDKRNAPPLTVLEGTDVIRLLLAKPRVANKFFGLPEGGNHV